MVKDTTMEPDLPWNSAPVSRSIDCGTGWWPLIRELDADLRTIWPDYRVGQVKEKFAGLRYYTDPVPASVFDRFNARIRVAEKLSEEICEVCGSPGSVRSRRGWLKTLCDKHDAGFQAGTPGWAL